MSETLETETQENEAPETGLLRRTFAAEMTAGDGRTVDVRIVPYGETATSTDGYGGVPRGVPYKEQWMPGVFAGQTNAANRVLANFEHQPGIGGVVGHGIALVERQDGFYGSFKMHETPDGDKTLMLVREGVLSGVSLEVPARTVKSVRSASGIVQRIKGHLHGVALCRQGAYSSSVVLAVRTPAIFDEEILPVDLDPETVDRCRRLGIELPQRYQAHPAETDTSAEADTSDTEAAPVDETTNPVSEGTP